MIEDIRDWVMARDTPLILIWHGERILEFKDELHYYRMLDTYSTSVAPIEGFERWGPSTAYHMEQLPHSKEALMKLVGICQHLTKYLRVPDRGSRTVELGPLDIGPVYEIDSQGMPRLEVIDEIGRHFQREVGMELPRGVEVELRDIESLVDIVIG